MTEQVEGHKSGFCLNVFLFFKEFAQLAHALAKYYRLKFAIFIVQTQAQAQTSCLCAGLVCVCVLLFVLVDRRIVFNAFLF